MSKINEMNLLLIKRDLLIEKQKTDLEALKFQFVETREVVNLANIIKETFVNKNLKANLINIALGIATNYIGDKFPSFSFDTKIQKIAKRLFNRLNFLKY